MGIDKVFTAISEGNVCALTRELEKNPRLVNGYILLRWTVMHEAASRGHASIIDVLVQFGNTTIDALTPCKKTPMYIAACRGHLSVIEALVRLGSTSIDAPDMRGESPLYLALKRGKWDRVELLRILGANCSIPQLSLLTEEQRSHLDEPLDENESAEILYRVYFDRSCVSRLLFHLDTVKRPSFPSIRY